MTSVSKKQTIKPNRKMFTPDFDRRVWITGAVVIGALLVGATLTLYAAWPDRIRVGYAPEQVLPYSHQLHAGSLQIRCRYCHTGVDSGPHATVPPVSVCMNCHANFKGDPEDQEQVEEIGKLLAAWVKQEPLVWNKVYDLEDYVYFDHSRHTATGLDCRNCHGMLEAMPVVRQESPLTMGWCLKCHMGEREIALEPDFLLTGQEGAQLIEDPVFREIMAPINCSTCHR